MFRSYELSFAVPNHRSVTEGKVSGAASASTGRSASFPFRMESAFPNVSSSRASPRPNDSAPSPHVSYGSSHLHILPTGSSVSDDPAVPNIDALHAIPSGAPAFAKGIKSRFKKKAQFLMQANVQESTILLSRGSKQYVYDQSGNEYLDCVNSTSHVGHCHPQVVAAGQNQLAVLSSAQGFVSDLLSKYVKEIVNTLPERLSVCYLCNSGSEANDLAIRLARQYTGAEDIVAIDGSYHGNLSNLVDLSSKIHRTVPNFKSKEWVHLLELPNFYDGRHTQNYKNEEEATQKYIEEMEAYFEKLSASGRRVAAHISEPYLVIPGLYIPPKAYIQALYRTVRKHGGLIIADEVQTGLGRTGEAFWGFQSLDVVPDIVTIGKPLGNGYPIGAVICTKDISDKLGGYFSTFGGNPVACAMGLAVMDVIYNEKLISSAKSVGRLHGNALNAIKFKYPNMLGDVRGQGLMWALEIVQDGSSRQPCPELAQLLMFGMKAHKILLAITGKHRNIILFTPPMCFTVENSRRFCESLDDVLKSCKATYDITHLSLEPKKQRRKRPLSVHAMDEEEDGVTEEQDEDEEEDDTIDSKKARMELEEYEDLD